MLAPLRIRGFAPYLAGLSFVVVAAVVRWRYDTVLGDHASFTFFFLAVSISAWIGGLRPAFATAILSCMVGNYYFSHPHGTFYISGHEEAISLLIFVAVSIVIGLLAEKSLRALERAKAAERAKDTFLATLAHELRSPLSVIQYANELHRIAKAGESRDQVEVIQRQVQHLDSLVQDLLDVSRIARGKIRLDRRHVNAAAIVKGAVEKARPTIIKREHTLTVELPKEPVPVYVDTLRMEQVLTNLLVNAAKYTTDGGQITLRLDSAGDQAVFTVRDNGMGISPEALPRVFELFVQEDSGSKHASSGLGIGLALVRKIVELHDGNVTAESAGKDCGSEFTVSIPLDQPATVTNDSDLANPAVA
jgi:signal transduction histidine kinase